MHARFVIPVLIALLLLLPGCGSSHKEILGKWKVDGDGSGVVWEFNQNGKARMGETEARYTFGDGNRLKLQTPSATFVHQMELHGDRMVWTDRNGARTELTRLK